LTPKIVIVKTLHRKLKTGPPQTTLKAGKSLKGN
jgi:hypothetical protein